MPAGTIPRVTIEPEAIDIRAWEPRDHEAVQGLLHLLSGDAEVKNHDAPTYVAVSDEQVVGMVTLCVYCTLTGPKAYLDHLVVDPRWRRRGIARRLVQHAVEQAGAAGASRVGLTANDTKHAARALYESLGFRQKNTGVFQLEL